MQELGDLDTHPRDHGNPEGQVRAIRAQTVQIGIRPETITALDLQQPALEAARWRRRISHGHSFNDHRDLRDPLREPTIEEPRPGEPRIRCDVHRARRDAAGDDPLDMIGIPGSEGTLFNPHVNRQRATVLELHHVTGLHVLQSLVDRINVEETQDAATWRPARADAVELRRDQG